MAIANDDEQCPARGAGLGHIADDTPDCSYCGTARRRHAPPTPEVRRVAPVVPTYARFMRALGLLFCTTGNHASENAFYFEGKGYCPEHLPEPALQDPISPGVCEWSKPHKASAVRFLPFQNRMLCGKHLAELLAELWRRSDYGKH